MAYPVIFGLDKNKVIRPLLLAADGSPIISGYDGFPLLNYATTLRFYWEDLALLVGVNTHDFGGLLAHQMCFITGVWFRYSSTIAANHVRWSINDGVNDFPFIDQLGPVANTGYSFQTNIPIHAGDHVICTITAAVAGNDIFTAVHGWMMNVP
jgi:hypothetical protein